MGFRVESWIIVSLKMALNAGSSNEGNAFRASIYDSWDAINHLLKTYNQIRQHPMNFFLKHFAYLRTPSESK